VERRIKSDNVLLCQTELFVEHGASEQIRSDKSPEFMAKEVRHWLGRIGVKTLYIEPGSPRENSYNESFNGKLMDELLNGEIFYTLRDAQGLIERRHQHCRLFRPHSALNYQPQALEAIQTSSP
jgi:transposase InsO family protein